MQKTKRVLAANNGGDDPSLLASTFQFVAPVVGPLDKDAFVTAFTGFKLEQARSYTNTTCPFCGISCSWSGEQANTDLATSWCTQRNARPWLLCFSVY